MASTAAASPGAATVHGVSGILAHVETRLMTVALAHSKAATQRKGLRAWRRLPQRLGARVAQAAAAFQHQRARKGVNAWTELARQRRRRLKLLRFGLSGFIRRQLRAAVNSWTATLEMRRLARRRLKHAGHAWRDRAMRCAWRKAIMVGRQYRLAKRAARAFVLKSLRKGANSWLRVVAERHRRLHQLRAGGAAFAHRNTRAAMNAWIAAMAARVTALLQLHAASRSWVNRAVMRAWHRLAEAGRDRRLMRRAATSLLQRNWRRGINSWQALVAERHRWLHQLRAGGAAFAHRNTRAAMNAWIAAMAARVTALLQLHAASRSWVNRAVMRAWHRLAEAGRDRRLLRRALASFAQRESRRSMNTWRQGRLRRHWHQTSRHRIITHLAASASRRSRAAHSVWREHARACAATSRALRTTLYSVRHRHVRRAINQFIDARSQRLRLHALMRGAISRACRVAFNSWSGRDVVRAQSVSMGQRALAQWQAASMGQSWRRWGAYTLWCNGRGAPPSTLSLPLRDRLARWARTRQPRPACRTIRVAADDKSAMQRLLLVPFAALVIHRDGRLRRVVDVRKVAGELGCAVEVAATGDEYLLTRQPLPPERAFERQARGAPTVRVLGTALSASVVGAEEGVRALVPGFFGGVLPLSNGCEVCVCDADFGDPRMRVVADGAAVESGACVPAGESHFGTASAVSERDAAPDSLSWVGARGQPAASPQHDGALQNVKLTLVDERGKSVGRAVWCDVHEVLALLADQAVVVATIELEQALRRRSRLELHKAEQRRLALANLRQPAHREALLIREDKMEVLGMRGLLAQLDESAPSALLEGGRAASTASLVPPAPVRAATYDRQEPNRKASSGAAVSAGGHAPRACSRASGGTPAGALRRSAPTLRASI